MDDKTKNSASRREFIKKLAYIPPAIVSLTVLPAFQASGSGLTGHDRSRDNSWSNNWGDRHTSDSHPSGGHSGHFGRR